MKLILVKDISIAEFLQKNLGEEYLVLYSNDLEKAIEKYEI